MQNRTTFIVAHRLSTIHQADQIIVLENGKVVEIGQHQDLMDNKNLYYNLYKLKMQNPVIMR
jgi:ABC-type multidrug transport system fused ATPase/permease subunit